jgi:hypothetical protein
MSRVRMAALLFIAASCARQPAPPNNAPRDTATAQVMLRIARVGGTYMPQESDSAIAAFRPAVPPADSGGSCRIARTSGSGATSVYATFRARDSSSTNVSLLFDSAGSLIRFTDTRGSRPIRPPPGATPAYFDSTRNAALSRYRLTTITVDYAADVIVAGNHGGNLPDEIIAGTVRRLENLAILGPPTARIRRTRALCGV